MTDQLTGIRKARAADARIIRELLDGLGYPATCGHVEKQLAILTGHPDHEILIYELDGEVAGFIALYFVPSLAVDDGIAVINYLAVDERHIGKGYGKALEQQAEKLAWERHCDRMQVHCRVGREKAHGFYKSRGYREYPVFYQRRLIYAE